MAFLIFLYFGVIMNVGEGNILGKFHNFGCLEGNIELENGNLVFIEGSTYDTGHTYLLKAAGEDFETFSDINVDLNIQSKTVTEYSRHNLQKSSSMLINELAQFNNINLVHSLVAEHGPAHQKIFTVQLRLGNEEYEGIGNSLKEAKRIASAKALKNTKYEHPPTKNIEIQLRELASKRNEEVVFTNEYGHQITSSKDLQNPTLFPAHNIHKLRSIRISENHENNTVHENITEIKNTTGDYLNNLQTPDDPYMVHLKVGNREYIGIGYTTPAARHDAAIKAIEEIKRINIDGNFDNTINANIQIKSPVSLIYETAAKLKKQVIFSMIKEEGPPHARLFTSRCQVDELIAEVEGFSKKKARQAAAELMLEKFQKLGWLELTSSNKEKKKRNKKKNKINKENVHVSEEVPDIIYEKEPTLISESQKIKNTVIGKNRKSMKDTLIELAKKLGISVQYWDIPKNNHEKYLTFVSLDITPSQICFGMDSVLETSREIASLKAFEELQRQGLDNIFTNNIQRTRKPDYVQSMVGDNKQSDYSYETKLY
ncbi:double-stranded RNA-binding protein Staufen homolog isoform X2 [Agrilus planipennis]|uniref:Double-stranded RNA-binding protein Staufen homolog isoform X2 n=1 Tax=Agrilus planipennis TaxID=224129 RepID=A0A7F5QVE5_AGRPL|nr:double-stranded RNA-binding protein Staufen homolog isoform X2 [Agrilus planipennis]